MVKNKSPREIVENRDSFRLISNEMLLIVNEIHLHSKETR